MNVNHFGEFLKNILKEVSIHVKVELSDSNSGNSEEFCVRVDLKGSTEVDLGKYGEERGIYIFISRENNEILYIGANQSDRGNNLKERLQRYFNGNDSNFQKRLTEFMNSEDFIEVLDTILEKFPEKAKEMKSLREIVGSNKNIMLKIFLVKKISEIWLLPESRLEEISCFCLGQLTLEQIEKLFISCLDPKYNKNYT